jgi:ribosome-associated toxin RatA of RatAB toxin-antitoxin module
MSLYRVRHWIGATLLAGLFTLTQVQGVGNAEVLRFSEDPSGVRHIDAKVVINASPSLVWKMMTNYEQLPNVVPGYKSATVYQQSGNQALVGVQMELCKLLPRFKYTLKVNEFENEGRLTLERTAGDFKQVKGTYRLVSDPAGKSVTLLYSLAINPGVSLPGTNHILKANVNDGLLAMKQAVERHPQLAFGGKK